MEACLGAARPAGSAPELAAATRRGRTEVTPRSSGSALEIVAARLRGGRVVVPDAVWQQRSAVVLGSALGLVAAEPHGPAAASSRCQAARLRADDCGDGAAQRSRDRAGAAGGVAPVGACGCDTSQPCRCLVAAFRCGRRGDDAARRPRGRARGRHPARLRAEACCGGAPQRCHGLAYGRRGGDAAQRSRGRSRDHAAAGSLSVLAAAAAGAGGACDLARGRQATRLRTGLAAAVLRSEGLGRRTAVRGDDAGQRSRGRARGHLAARPRAGACGGASCADARAAWHRWRLAAPDLAPGRLAPGGAGAARHA